MFFPYWESDFLRTFQSHDKGTTNTRGNHTIQYDSIRFSTLLYVSYDFTCFHTLPYDSVRFHMLFSPRTSWRFAQVIHDEPYLA